MIPIGTEYTAAFLASTQKAALTKASHSIGRCISLSQKALDNAEIMKTMTMMTMIRVVAMMAMVIAIMISIVVMVVMLVMVTARFA